MKAQVTLTIEIKDENITEFEIEDWVKNVLENDIFQVEATVIDVKATEIEDN